MLIEAVNRIKHSLTTLIIVVHKLVSLSTSHFDLHEKHNQTAYDEGVQNNSKQTCKHLSLPLRFIIWKELCKNDETFCTNLSEERMFKIEVITSFLYLKLNLFAK